MNWFYALDGRQHGPVAESQLDALLQAGMIKPETLVWIKGAGPAFLENLPAWSGLR